jgi:homoserine O-acetyltransferase
MASQPTAMASRNWMMRRMMIETIRSDPDYKGGDYTAPPRSLKIASMFYGIATNGGTLHYQSIAPTREKADEFFNGWLAAPMMADANDFIWAWEASADYDAMPGIGKIKAALLAINSADDERNPPETGLVSEAMKQVKNGKLLLIPASEETRGHSTAANARFYKDQLEELLRTAPHRGT